MIRLPQPPTALVGRERAIASLVERVTGARLVTLTGLGGVGKSRLALAVAHVLSSRGIAVAYVEARRVHDIGELVVSMGQALEQPPDSHTDAHTDPATALAQALARLPRHVVVLDDVEHLALGGAAAAMIEALLAYAPTTSLLITSRVPLGLIGEEVVGVRPLDAAGVDSAAVQLLLARAGAVAAWRDDADAVARLAAHLDGIPLALELAAARARIVAPDELRRLLGMERGGPPSPRDEAVRWAWQTLDAPLRDALTGLAVLGAFDLDGAAAALGLPPADALGVIEALDRVSLLLADPAPTGTRYQVLETVREFVAMHGDRDVAAAAWERFAHALTRDHETSLDVHAVWPEGFVERIFAERDHYLECARRALAEPTVTSVTLGLRAAAMTVPVFFRRAVPFAVTLPFVDLLRHPAALLAPATLRVRAALAILLYGHFMRDARAVEREINALAAAWHDAVDEPSVHLELGLRKAFNALWGWRLVGHVVDIRLREAAVVAGTEGAWLRAVVYETMTRRALGQAQIGVDDVMLEEAARLAEARGWHDRQWLCRTNLAFLHNQLGRPDVALRQVAHSGAVVAGRSLMASRPYVLREQARADVALGRLLLAARRLDEVLVCFQALGLARDETETALERVALALERGELDVARELLERVVPTLETPLDQNLHQALASALEALGGGAVYSPAVREPATGTVEDLACMCWRAVGADVATVDATIAAMSSASPHSTRVRQALRVLRAARDSDAAVWVAHGDRALCLGGVWIDLDPKPALRTLWQALVEARLDTVGASVDRAALTARLWPGERLSAKLRDNRLNVNIATLRKLGVGELLEVQGGGYRLDPTRPLLRVDAARFPRTRGTPTF